MRIAVVFVAAFFADGAGVHGEGSDADSAVQDDEQPSEQTQ